MAPRRSLHLLLSALLAGGVPLLAQEGRQPNGPSYCVLALSIQSGGTATVGFTLAPPAGTAGIEPQEFEDALKEMFQVPLRNVQRACQAQVFTMSAAADRVFVANRQGVIAGELDIEPLAALVHQVKVAHIQVSVFQLPGSVFGVPELRPLQLRVATAAPEPIRFSFTQETPSPSGRLGLSWVLVVIPVGLLFWKRRAALRRPDPTEAWYPFWRWSHWITLGTWIGWLTVCSIRADPSLAGLIADSELWRDTAWRWVLTLVPPWLVTIVASTLSQEVYGRLSGEPLPRREVWRRLLLGLTNLFIPAILLLVGLSTILQGEHRAGAAWMAAAIAVHLVAVGLTALGPDLTPHAVTFGTLRDRIFDLASLAGVKLQQIYVLPSGKMPQANAFAVQGGNVLFTEHLLRQLTSREIDAIIAHELGHLKHRHPGWLGGILVFGIGLIGIGSSVLMPAPPPFPIALVLALFIFYFVARRFEYQTDAYAAWVVGDPEALITGLIKIQRLNLMPMQWSGWEELLLTHPSTSARLEAIARSHGVSCRRLRDLTGKPEVAGEPYPLPATLVDQELIFSPSLKARARHRNSYAILTALLLIPAAGAALVHWLDLTGTARMAVLGGGCAVLVSVLLWLQNILPVRICPEVCRRLRLKLKAQGIDPDASGGIFVSFAPDASPRLYEGYTNWDFGFVFLDGGRLTYIGDLTRFTLRREQLLSLRLERGSPRWWPAPYLYLAWRDDTTGTSGTFNIRAAEVSSMRQLSRQTYALADKVRHWQERPSSGEAAALPSFAAPIHGEVSSVPVEEVYNSSRCLGQAWLLLLLGAGISLLLGLSINLEEFLHSGFALERLGPGWYVPVVMALAIWLEALPFWWRALVGRRRKHGFHVERKVQVDADADATALARSESGA